MAAAADARLTALNVVFNTPLFDIHRRSSVAEREELPHSLVVLFFVFVPDLVARGPGPVVLSARSAGASFLAPAEHAAPRTNAPSAVLLVVLAVAGDGVLVAAATVVGAAGHYASPRVLGPAINALALLAPEEARLAVVFVVVNGERVGLRVVGVVDATRSAATCRIFVVRQRLALGTPSEAVFPAIGVVVLGFLFVARFLSRGCCRMRPQAELAGDFTRDPMCPKRDAESFVRHVVLLPAHPRWRRTSAIPSTKCPSTSPGERYQSARGKPDAPSGGLHCTSRSAGSNDNPSFAPGRHGATFAPMRLLVTGCTGFIGSHLTRLLLAQGHSVVGLVRNPDKLDEDLRGRIEQIRGDLSLFRDLHVVLPDVDVVVHLAAVIAGENEAEYAAINYEAVKDVLTALSRQTFRPRRFVFASSLAAAGPTHGDAVHTETDHAEPIDAYGRAKRDAERLMASQPFPTTSFRPPLVLGAGDPATLTLYKMARAPIAFLPAGEPQRLSFVAVTDLVRAIVAMAEDVSSEHRLYYTTSETPTTNRGLLVAMARALSPERPRQPVFVPVPHFLLYFAMLVTTALSAVFRFKNQLDRKQLAQMTAPSFTCTSARLTADTGFRAETTLERATEDAVAGYRARGQL